MFNTITRPHLPLMVSESKHPRKLSDTRTAVVSLLLIPPTTSRLLAAREGSGEGKRALATSLSTVMVILDEERGKEEEGEVGWRKGKEGEEEQRN